MGTELIRHHVKEENIEIPSIPPGFESLTAFSLKRVENTLVADSCSVSATASELQTAKLEPGFEYNSEDEQIKRSLRRKPWINYSRFGSSSGDESDCEKVNQISLPSVTRLPKGVVRGCDKCSNCQKVIATWHPEGGRQPELQDAPVFYPSEEEFEDSLKYIASIRDKAEAFGICRIVPPPSWRPPCPLKQKNIWESSKFATRVQRIDKLQNRDSVRKMVRSNNHKKRKRRRCMKGGTGLGTPGVDELGPVDSGVYDVDFGFEPGPQFTLEAFQKYADDFKTQYFRKNGNVGDAGGNLTNNQDHWEPTVENIEGEYWRMVENPTEEIEVLYGADLETGSFGSGFPKMSHQVSCASEEKYIKSGWNLNNFPRLPGSVLSYESSDISGVLVPWLYVGMCFSSFCWHVEDHHLYSINYMHWGAPKMWYGVAGKDAAKLEAAMRKHLPDLFAEQPDLLHKLVTQLSPSILKAEGVPVFRCIQNPGDFVLTFPRAYHSGFNCGFNCAEAVNVAPVDWLPHGQNAIELYREQGRKTSISHDKLLLGAARDAVNAHWEINLLRKNTPNNLRWKDVCGRDGILSKALKVRVEMERVRREFLCNSSQALKMETTFDATSERECSVCLFDLHLSAAGCHYCSPDRYACLNHAKQFCSCSWGAKFFLFRYDINDLNILVEALQGKLSAIYRWAKLDLGLALTSYVSKDNLQCPGFDGKVSCSPGGAAMRDVKSLPSISFSKEHKGKEKAKEFLKLTMVGNKMCLPRKDKPPSLHGAEAKILCKKEESSHSAPNDMGKQELKKPVIVTTDNVILLSDDEDELPSPTPRSERLRYSLLKHTKDSGVLADSNDEVSAGMCIDKPVLTTSTQSAAVGQEVTATSTRVEGTINNTFMTGCERGGDQGKEEKCGSHLENHSFHGAPSSIIDPYDLSSGKETGDCSVETATAALPHPLLSHGGKPVNEENNRMILTDSVQITSGSPCTQNNLDRYFRQKGPRIAKVVRRINCNVEPLEYGIVQTGKLWCDSRAIYPKGFRSRVRYISVLDPTVMCYYISEIVDAQQDRPLFMVSLENCPNEVFIHLSAARCWEMVRDRVNQEITKQHKSGRLKLPPLQPPGSLDGMEMFGFSSPAILQAIQAMDRQCLCTEYWESRPFRSLSEDNSGALPLQTQVPNNPDANKDNQISTGADTILCGLLNKANPEELNILSSFLNRNNPTTDQGLLTRLLNEEILKRSR